MDVGQFERALRAFPRRTPFRSFAMDLVDSDRIALDHPEALVLRDRIAVVIAAAGVSTLVDLSSVSRLVREPLFQRST
ncbi:MAG: hypothetical protein ACLQVF_00240 [Isosphaeraceae bacterium]